MDVPQMQTNSAQSWKHWSSLVDDCHTKILSILEKFKSNILLDLDVFLFGQIGKNV